MHNLDIYIINGPLLSLCSKLFQSLFSSYMLNRDVKSIIAGSTKHTLLVSSGARHLIWPVPNQFSFLVRVNLGWQY